MRSPAAQVLETALALQRAPGERFRLRERPLPAGLVHALEIAAGSPQALQSVAAELGQPEQEVLEATRFYLEQVLFAAPDADAYRVLGLAPDAPQETVRMHHRWLQRWLHPDRAVAGDATVFATRVNQAFAQLRTPELRHGYDVRLAEARLAGASAPLAAETVRRWEQSEDDAPAGGRRSRWLLGAALVSCAVLTVLIVRNPEENTASWQPDDAGHGAKAERHEPPEEDRDLGVLSKALYATPSFEQEPPVATMRVAEASRATPVIAMPAPPQAIATARMAPPSNRWLRPPAGEQAPSSPVQAAKLRAAPPSRPDAGAGVPAVAVPAVAAPVPTPPVAAEAAPTPVAISGAIAAAAPPAPDPEIMFTRMRLAEQRVDQVVGYLGARPGAVPIWNDPSVEAEAARLRGRLNARGGSLELTGPAWRMRPDRASLNAGYRCRAVANGSCEGRFVVDLVWREGLWLVRGVSLAPSA